MPSDSPAQQVSVAPDEPTYGTVAMGRKPRYFGFFFLRGGFMTGRGKGAESLVMRASGSLGDFEFGNFQNSATGFVFEMRSLDWAWLPSAPDPHIRLGAVTLGARFHVFTLFDSDVRRIPEAVGPESCPGPLSCTYKPTGYMLDCETKTQYFAFGPFVRGNGIAATYRSTDANEDGYVFAYDPYVEAGLVASLNAPFKLAGGLELTAGAGASLYSGMSVFLRAEVLLVGDRTQTDFQEVTGRIVHVRTDQLDGLTRAR